MESSISGTITPNLQLTSQFQSLFRSLHSTLISALMAPCSMKNSEKKDQLLLFLSCHTTMTWFPQNSKFSQATTSWTHFSTHSYNSHLSISGVDRLKFQKILDSLCQLLAWTVFSQDWKKPTEETYQLTLNSKLSNVKTLIHSKEVRLLQVKLMLRQFSTLCIQTAQWWLLLS